MSFSYEGNLDSSLEKVRYYIRDVTEDSGPLPADANFLDEELNGLITAEGSWQRAVAAAFEALAAAWMRHPTFSDTGFRIDRSDIAKGYAAQAKEWRDRYGGAGISISSSAVTRIDGYSDDIDNFED